MRYPREMGPSPRSQSLAPSRKAREGAFRGRSSYSFLWVPSHMGLVPLCLQPQNHLVPVTSAV